MKDIQDIKSRGNAPRRFCKLGIYKAQLCGVKAMATELLGVLGRGGKEQERILLAPATTVGNTLQGDKKGKNSRKENAFEKSII